MYRFNGGRDGGVACVVLAQSYTLAGGLSPPISYNVIHSHAHTCIIYSGCLMLLQLFCMHFNTTIIIINFAINFGSIGEHANH